MIRFEDVHKSYGSHEVLKGIDAEVAKGQVVCLIGPSGSGKSTLLRCVNGLETYQRGRITIDGALVDAEGPAIHGLRTRVSMVFQRFNLFPHRTALENVMEGPIHVLREPASEVRARASSVWPSPARWPCGPTRSCSTSRPRPSTPKWSARCCR